MLNIWFSNEKEEKSTQSLDHESFLYHLEQSFDPTQLVIYSAFEQDSSLRAGLRKLKSHFHTSCNYKGPLRSSTEKFISQACYEFLHIQDVLPIMVSESSAYQAILDSGELINPIKRKVFIDKKIDLSMINSEFDLSSTGYLAVQKHYTEEHAWLKCEEESYNFLRLGQLKNQLDVAEAIIRDAEYIEFNINSIKHSDLQSNTIAPITGLSIEEACQLMKYAGSANNLRFLNISGYNPAADKDDKIGECVAMLLWYFVDGHEARTHVVEDLNKTDFQEFLVQPNHLSIELKFFKHKVTGQWWVKLPEEINDEEMVLACSERDYYQACNDEVSDRLMLAISVI